MNGRRIRRWLAALVLLVLGAGVAIGAYWLGPGVVPRARLELVALDADNRFSAEARLATADSLADIGPPRFTLILGLFNTGERAARARSLFLSLPPWARILDEKGAPVPQEGIASGPLLRHRFELPEEEIGPGTLPVVPAGLERLWLVPDLAAVTCRLRWDRVPELVPTPPYDATLLARIEAFYSIEAGSDRHTGRLVLELDPALAAPGRMPFDSGVTTVQRTQIPLPRLALASLEGERESECGRPELADPIRTVVWRVAPPGAARLLIVTVDGSPRRLLYDVDGDGRVDLEAWDGDADGLFEGSRPAAYAIPEFLLPVRLLATADSTAAQPGAAEADSAAPPSPGPRPWLRWSAAPATTAPPRPAPPDSLRRGPARRDTLTPAPVRTDTTRRDTLGDSIRRDTLGPDSIRRDTIRVDTLRRDTLRPDTLELRPAAVRV